MDNGTKWKGVVESIEGDIIYISGADGTRTYRFPDAFANQLLLSDRLLQEEIKGESVISDFSSFKNLYINAINDEISYLKKTGGHRYRLIDGELMSSKNGSYLYAFDTDSDLNFPDGTQIKIWI